MTIALSIAAVGSGVALTAHRASPPLAATTLVASSPSPSPLPRQRSPRVPARPQPVPVHLPASRTARPGYASCRVPSDIRATQVVLVRSSGVTATVWACTRQASGYRADLGPYYGHVGYTGVIAASSKREGDGHTPAGVYALSGGFGLRANPGLAQGWAPVHHGDVWVDDPGSRFYNLRETGPADGRWRSAESLDQPGPYDYAQVIAYNTARTPGRGSAIFLHVDTGGSTAGCVAVPETGLLNIFRWERSGAVISIS